MSDYLRLAVRALILHDARLLLVNAWPGQMSDLWGAPGGGVNAGQSLPDNLVREVVEETGLTVAPGPLALVNEFRDSVSGCHQVDLFFRATITGGCLDAHHEDPEGIVNRWRFFSADEMAAIRFKPDSLAAVAFAPEGGPARYDPLEEIVR